MKLGAFGKPYQTKVSGSVKSGARVAKKSKQRFAITLLIASATGGKDEPIMIWKFENPSCFKRVATSLPIRYYSQIKAWMTADIF